MLAKGTLPWAYLICLYLQHSFYSTIVLVKFLLEDLFVIQIKKQRGHYVSLPHSMGYFHCFRNILPNFNICLLVPMVHKYLLSIITFAEYWPFCHASPHERLFRNRWRIYTLDEKHFCIFGVRLGYLTVLLRFQSCWANQTDWV